MVIGRKIILFLVWYSEEKKHILSETKAKEGEQQAERRDSHCRIAVHYGSDSSSSPGCYEISARHKLGNSPARRFCHNRFWRHWTTGLTTWRMNSLIIITKSLEASREAKWLREQKRWPVFNSFDLSPILSLLCAFNWRVIKMGYMKKRLFSCCIFKRPTTAANVQIAKYFRFNKQE